MPEYIKRETAIKRVMETKWESGSDGGAAMEIVAATPAADVAPAVHGRWIEKDKYTFGVMYDCSICDNRILDTGHSWNYCPVCGAKMDGGED